MDGETWKRIERVFYEAIERPPSERPSFLDVVCGEDRELRSEVEALLEHHTETGDLFGTARELADDLLRISTDVPLEGRSVGLYRIEREVGAGGMGRVFLAQREDVPKRVALKLVREPLASPDRIRRFQIEQRVLAGLDHAHIAQLLDAGVTEDGAPYFAMEYVEGEPISAFCDRQQLAVNDRLRLFLDVCSAVSCAHTRLIVHRDIKPSNVLVTEDGRAKLLDFGVAKLLTPDDDANVTHTGARVFTPNYASPEQLTGEPVTTATDVYQLGALLYELLAGRPPLDLADKTPVEAVRIVGERDPLPPSVAATSDAVGAERSPAAERLRHRLKGDLDNIVLKALEKRPERRYGSVEAFGRDIERFLEGRPVEARPGTPAYRLRKFVLRNRVVVGIAAAVIGYALTVTLSAAGIARERDRAEREAATANRVSTFLTGLFEAADPFEALGDTVTARELLDRGAVRIDRELSAQPEIRARLLTTLGASYRNLGELERAEELLGEAVATLEEVSGEGDPAVADAWTELARVYVAQYRSDEAEKLLRRALAVREESLGPDDPSVGETLLLLAPTLMADPERDDEDEAMLRRAAAIYERAEAGPTPELATALAKLGEFLDSRGRYEEAIPLYERAARIREETLGPDHPDLAESLHVLALLQQERGDLGAADSLLQRALAIQLRVFGREHPQTVWTLNALATLYRRQGRLEDARATYQEVLEIAERIYGAESNWMAIARGNLGYLLIEMGRLGEAEEQMRGAHAIMLALWPPDHPNMAWSLENMATIHSAKGELDEAAGFLERAIAIRETVQGPRHLGTASHKVRLADIYRQQGRHEDAMRLYAGALEVYQDIYGADHPETMELKQKLEAEESSVGSPQR